MATAQSRSYITSPPSLMVTIHPATYTTQHAQYPLFSTVALSVQVTSWFWSLGCDFWGTYTLYCFIGFPCATQFITAHGHPTQQMSRFPHLAYSVQKQIFECNCETAPTALHKCYLYLLGNVEINKNLK